MPLPPTPFRRDPAEAPAADTLNVIPVLCAINAAVTDYLHAQEPAKQKEACRTVGVFLAKTIIEHPGNEGVIIDALKTVVKRRISHKTTYQAALTNFARAIGEERQKILATKGQSIEDTRDIISDLLRTLTGEYREGQ